MLSVPEAEALNPQLQGPPDQPLPEGTWVNIIDPEFAPLLAAEVVIADGISHVQKAGLGKRLVPLSVANRTALDTVAARLLMATAPRDLAALRSL